MQPRRLTFPAPVRCWYTTPAGISSRQWTLSDVREYRAAGGWFVKGRHQFQDLKAAQAAGVKDD